MKHLVSILILIAASVNAYPNPHKVHFVYLIPTDKTNVAEQDITHAALHLQAWYRWQMGNGKTFTVNDPVVEVYYTTHDSTWYSTYDCCGYDPYYWWWYNVQADANDLSGAWWCCTDFDDWVVFIDVPDYGLGGGLNNGYRGIALLADVAGVQGIDPNRTQCWAIGGTGHELGHTFGLSHPPEGDPDWPSAIMGLGYTTYPNAVLRQTDRDTLNANPFFDYLPQVDPPVGLCGSSPTPTPTPISLPAPVARPASNVQNTSFKMNWNAVQNATSYRVDVAWDINFAVLVVNDYDVGNLLGQFVYGCSRHTDYYYRVRAYNGRESPNSNIVHVQTK